MTITFRRAAASEAKPLVGIYAESGCGKTKSALLLAKGFVEAMGGTMADVGMIETESGRGEAYANDPVVGGYQVLSLREEFSPSTYGAAIAEAERAKLRALIVDSASHEWEGVGGVLAMAAKNQADDKKGPLVWQQPKILHQREFMGRLLQTPIPLVIVCMRAKYPMYQVTQKDLEAWEAAGKPGMRPKVGDWARSWKLEPKQSEDILYEMFVHGWIDQDHRFHLTKSTVDALRTVFVDGDPISVATGAQLAAWAGGRTVPSATGVATRAEEGVEYINADQVANLETLCQDARVPLEKLRAAAKVDRLALIKADDYPRALGWIKKASEQRAA